MSKISILDMIFNLKSQSHLPGGNGLSYKDEEPHSLINYAKNIWQSPMTCLEKNTMLKRCHARLRPSVVEHSLKWNMQITLHNSGNKNDGEARVWIIKYTSEFYVDMITYPCLNAMAV